MTSFVNVAFGLLIMLAAFRIMPSVPRRAGTRLDLLGAIVLFIGLLCLIGPLLFGHDAHWGSWVWLTMIAGVAIVAAFPSLERAVARRGGIPLIDLSLLADTAFMRGLGAAFAERAKPRGTLVLIEGCAIQIAGLALLALTIASFKSPGEWLLALVLMVFGFGQMAPLSGVVLSTVKPVTAQARACMPRPFRLRTPRARRRLVCCSLRSNQLAIHNTHCLQR
jgi:hypothetical protein